ncbi:ABC transporter permease [Xanthomonas sp. XNM01]|uniref:ABC transporter permease n=1 Tax=Xanthomonas sp. XNM01 TaxID=2769289 RepID=UPI00177D7AEB|nr:ABC transporter permease [Xanthomonas sp. XNM01]MBD9369585.1 ABC transporter permease [Xanthomonas sp. XNM01]
MTAYRPDGRSVARQLLNPFSPYRSLFGYGRLVFDLTRRDISGRYRGAVVGSLWAFLTPLLMLAIYSFVFGYIFQARWTADETRDVPFPIVLFVGLVFANFLSECLNRGPTLVTSNPNYVKKVVFPLEVLPWIGTGSALFHAAISVVALLVAMVATGTPVAPTAVLLPLLFLLFLPMVAGMMWFLAAMGVFFRDLQQFMGVMSTALVFLAPIFYPRTMLPEAYRWSLSLNPLTFIVESARDLVLWNQLPAWSSVAGYGLASLAVAWFGWMVFQLTRRGFADVL